MTCRQSGTGRPAVAEDGRPGDHCRTSLYKIDFSPVLDWRSIVKSRETRSPGSHQWLDKTRYQRNALVQALADQLRITLLFLPSYSPNLNLIERRWKVTKRCALYGRYHPTFRDFQSSIQEALGAMPTK